VRQVNNNINNSMKFHLTLLKIYEFANLQELPYELRIKGSPERMKAYVPEKKKKSNIIFLKTL
jgi:hypothetical protein